MTGVLARQTFGRTANGRGVRLTTLTRRLRLALDLWSERRALDRLDDHMLEDIGLERWQAEREAARHPWDVPSARLTSVDRYRLWQGF